MADIGAPVVNDTDIKIANAALAMLASGAIYAWDEETDLAGQVNAVYTDTIDACLTAYDWSFARLTRPLEQLAEAPVNGWQFGFALPPGRLALPSLVMTSTRNREPLREFSIELDVNGNQSLFADRAPLWARYKGRAAVTLWSPSFRRFAVCALAAELAIPVSHDANLAGAFGDQAWGSAAQNRRAGLFSAAMTADLSQPNYEAMYGRDPLTSAWHGDA